MKKGAFTLVELIVVITILAILGTIGFISFSGYLTGARDTNRTSQLKAMSDALEIYAVKKTLPIPDDKVDIQASGTIIAYQGYLWANVLNTVEYSGKGLDPKDKTYFSYYLTKDKKYFQLLTFLEEPNEDVVAGIFKDTQAVDYSNRYPKVTGKKLWILTDTDNTPIQDVASVSASGYIDVLLHTPPSIAHFEDSDTFSGTGKLLYALMKHKALKKVQPDDCVEGFIPVPANPDIWQVWFCVAQYEMSHPNVTSPNSSWWDWNTVAYNSGLVVKSESWNYPIVDITQWQAITACKSLWNGYHLITNNEWMTIARNIELQKENWSWLKQWDWFISNWVSNESTLWCSGYTWWNSELRTYATKTGIWSDSLCNLKRKHKLSNGFEIWDLSGNIYEHVNKANTLDGSGYDTWLNPDISTTNAAWHEWSTASEWNQNNNAMLISSWNAINNGAGRYYQENGTVFVRWGGANGESYASIWTLRLNRATISLNKYWGFRCAK